MKLKLWVVAALSLAIQYWPTSVDANPNHQQVDAALAVHGKEFSADLQKKADELYTTAKGKLLDFLEKESKGDIQKIQAADLGDCQVLVTRLKRAADQLQLLGEPAGVDFDMRAGEMHRHLGRLIGASKSVPATQKYIEAFRQFIAKSAAARAKTVIELQELAVQRKWEKAETDLFKIMDRLEQGTVFLTVSENQAIYTPFSSVNAAIRSAMTEMRAAKAKEILQQAANDLMPRYPAIIEELNIAIAGLRTSSTTSWRGEQVSGPRLVEMLGQVWREAQVRALQSRGKVWALLNRRNAVQADPTSIPDLGMNQGNEKIGPEYTAFSGEMVKSLTALLDAEAARTDSTEVAARYIEYLRVLAPLVREANNKQIEVTLTAAIDKLPAKDPSLGKQVKAYEASTGELLRWRARVAETLASQQASAFAPIEMRFYEGTVSDATYSGLFPAQGNAEVQPQLLASAPDVMVTAVKRLVGQKATVRDVVRLPGESKSSIARYAARTYANVPAIVGLQGEIEALKQDLFVSEQSPPLTLSAMKAVTTAERGDMVAVGGEISGVHLEAVITRFAALPNSAAILTTLGALPSERIAGNGLNQMLMRFNVTPQWVLHDYFFARLVPSANATAVR